MMISKPWGWAASGLLLLTASFYAVGENSVPRTIHEDKQSALMIAKLASSQKVVNGLVSNDFKQIHQGATELKRICNAIESVAEGDQVYAHHLTEMRRLTEKLIHLAEQKNLDGAAFTYMHSLTVCIGCHQHCRDVLLISDYKEPTNKVVPIPTSERTATRQVEEPPVRR